jgi:predicted ester cyclase
MRTKRGHAILLSLSLLLTWPSTARAAGNMPSTVSEQERNKAVARRVFDEIFNQGKFAVADEIYSPEFVNHGLNRNFDLRADQDAVRQEKAAFPDLKMSVEMMVAEGDLVTVVWVFRGTHAHTGYGWLPPTGARIEMRGITVWRIVDGKIRDEWTVFNELQPFSQLLDHLKWLLGGSVLAALLLGWAALRGLRRALARSAKSGDASSAAPR